MTDTKFVSNFKNLIRMADAFGIDRIVCGNQSCLGELYRIRVQGGETRLLCAACERVAVVFSIGEQADGGRN